MDVVANLSSSGISTAHFSVGKPHKPRGLGQALPVLAADASEEVTVSPC